MNTLPQPEGALFTPITILPAWDVIGSEERRSTLLRGHTQNAARGARKIVRMGISPNKLGKRLERYVGSEPFQNLFEEVQTPSGTVAQLDPRKIPKEHRSAAIAMRYNARRIAMTEPHNARGEAEVQHMSANPLVKAVKWQSAPDRGSSRSGCACDILEQTDFYGLGPGVYPVDKVPVTPHPFCRCERQPVLFQKGEKRENPSPGRKRMASRARLPRGRTASANHTQRMRELAERSLTSAGTA